METETVTIAYVNQPKKNPKFGSIKTEGGDYISVPVGSLKLFEVGGTYEISYTYDATGQYKNFKSIVGSSPENKTRAPAKAEEMFVMGTIGKCLEGVGTYPDAPTLTGWVRTARQAWRNGFATGEQENGAGPNDEIPF